VASVAVAETEVEIHEVVARNHAVVRPVLVQNQQGQVGIILQVQPIAPFPQPQHVPPAKMAMMRMMATCRTEAFASCDVHEAQPVCPMKLAMCLMRVKSNTPEEISPVCSASLDFLSEFSPPMKALERQAETKEAESAPETMTADGNTHHTKHHSKWACLMHRTIHFLTHRGTFFLAVIAGFVFAMLFYLLLLLCKTCHLLLRRNSHLQPTVSTTEAPPLGYVTVEYNKVLTSNPWDLTKYHQPTSEMQV
jgi:hypothetical protein